MLNTLLDVFIVKPVDLGVNCSSTAIRNAVEDLLMAFRVINSSSPIKHPRSCFTPYMALIALQFLAFCFNSLPHHIGRRAFPVEALSPNRSAKECNRIRIRKKKKGNVSVSLFHVSCFTSYVNTNLNNVLIVPANKLIPNET